MHQHKVSMANTLVTALMQHPLILLMDRWHSIVAIRVSVTGKKPMQTTIQKTQIHTTTHAIMIAMVLSMHTKQACATSYHPSATKTIPVSRQLLLAMETSSALQIMFAMAPKMGTASPKPKLSLMNGSLHIRADASIVVKLNTSLQLHHLHTLPVMELNYMVALMPGVTIPTYITSNTLVSPQ